MTNTNEEPQKENPVNDFSEYLPAEHTAKIKKSPVVAFVHTSTKRDNGALDLHIRPATPNDRCCGYSEHLGEGEEIEAISKADPGAFMYSLEITGPHCRHGTVLGFEYPDATPVDWQKRAIKECGEYSEIVDSLGPILNGEKLKDGLMEAIARQVTDPALRDALEDAIKRGFGPRRP